MATSLNKDSTIVLKLDLGEDGLRRVPLQKLWDESNETVSFDHLVELILSFKKLPPKCVENERRVVTATYTDEDGDEITISSDSELLDAFEQYLGSQPPILRAKAVVVKVPMKKVVRKEAIKEQRKIMKEIRKEVKLEKKALKKQYCADLKRANISAPEVIRLPTVAPPKTVPKVVNAVKAVKAPTPTLPRTEEKPQGSNQFIHFRHTCDSCLTTPIFGTRYHAVNLPDYDLCSKCYPNCSDKNIIFKPVELDRDKHLQARWQRRYRRQCRSMMNAQVGRNEYRPNPNVMRLPEAASGTQTRRVIEEMDNALKEAIRRSLVDAAKADAERMKKNQKKTMTQEIEEKTDVKESTTVVKKLEKDTHVPPVVEKDIHVVPTPGEEQVAQVPQVVEIAAGNEATQRTLDDMDPKVKDALRKKLNAFFALRSKNNSAEEMNRDSTLVPNRETQKKIDVMDPDTKEAIRRSLNQFFENRCASKEEAEGKDSTTDSSGGVKMTEEILESIDEETRNVIRRSFNDFGTHHSGGSSSKDSVESSQIPSVIIDIEVDDDLSIGTDDVDVDVNVEGIAEGSRAGANTDEETADESDSGISEGTASREQWQIVSEDEMIAVAAHMLGSALFESDASSTNHDSNHDKE